MIPLPLPLAYAALLVAATPIAAKQDPAAAAVVPASEVIDDDIARFWYAYDAITATDDPVERLRLIRAIYIDPGTPGLHALMRARCYMDREYVEAIARYPRFWASVRPLTARSRDAVRTLDRDVAALRRLYPALRPATITYAIGILRTGGTTLGDKVLIGAELGLADETVDVSELPEPLRTRLSTFFRSRPHLNTAQTNLHEYVHTQQRETSGTLLQQALREGVAELVSELIAGRKPALPLYTYGPANDAAVRARFLAEMDGDSYGNWLWNNADNPFGVGDLGYYVGYRIARSHYDAAADKQAAIRTLIELPYDDRAAIRTFALGTTYLRSR